MFHKLSLNIKNIQIYLKIPMVAISRTLIIFMYSSSSMLSIEKIMHYLFKIFCTKQSPKILFGLMLDEEVIDMEKELNNFWNEEYPYIVALKISPLLSLIYVYHYRKYPSELHIMLNKNVELPHDLSFIFHVIKNSKIISEIIDLKGGIFFNRELNRKLYKFFKIKTNL